MNDKLPTSKQLERDLSQNIRSFYVDEINHSPQKITCKLFSQYVAIVADEALTPLEHNLWKSGNKDLIIKVRSEINSIFKPKLEKIIEQILNVKVEEILTEVAFAGNKLGTLVILSEMPVTRKPKSLSRSRKRPQQVY